VVIDFFQVFVNLYLKRDGCLATSIPGLTESLLLPYCQPDKLLGEDRIAQDALSEEVGSSDPEDKNLIEQLKEQNQRLIKENNKLHLEVATTGQTLEQMLAEYSRAFDKSQQQNQDRAAPEHSSEPTQVAPQPAEEQIPVDEEALAAAWSTEISLDEDEEKQPAVH